MPAKGPRFESWHRQSIDKRGSISEVATHRGASARNGPVRFRQTRAYCMATEPDRVHARLTLSPKTLYVGLASRVPPDGVGFLALLCTGSQPSPKMLGILGALIPVSAESRTALRIVDETWLGMKCYFPVRYIRSASFGSRESIRVHIQPLCGHLLGSGIEAGPLLDGGLASKVKTTPHTPLWWNW